jgi:plastocyanin
MALPAEHYFIDDRRVTIPSAGKHCVGLCMKRVFKKNSSQESDRYGFGAVALALTIIAALGVSAVSAADVVMVSQRDRKFSPDRIEFSRGSIARIVNDDKVTHHIYVDAPGLSFDSGEQPIGTTVDVRFDKAGTFDVLCAIHPTMHLRVVVK